MTLNEDDRRWCRALGHTPESRAIKEHLNALDLSARMPGRVENATEQCHDYVQVFSTAFAKDVHCFGLPSPTPRCVAILNLSGERCIVYSNGVSLVRALTITGAHSSDEMRVVIGVERVISHAAESGGTLLLTLSLPWQSTVDSLDWALHVVTRDAKGVVDDGGCTFNRNMEAPRTTRSTTACVLDTRVLTEQVAAMRMQLRAVSVDADADAGPTTTDSSTAEQQLAQMRQICAALQIERDAEQKARRAREEEEVVRLANQARIANDRVGKNWTKMEEVKKTYQASVAKLEADVTALQSERDKYKADKETERANRAALELTFEKERNALTATATIANAKATSAARAQQQAEESLRLERESRAKENDAALQSHERRISEKTLEVARLREVRQQKDAEVAALTDVVDRLRAEKEGLQAEARCAAGQHRAHLLRLRFVLAFGRMRFEAKTAPKTLATAATEVVSTPAGDDGGAGTPTAATEVVPTPAPAPAPAPAPTLAPAVVPIQVEAEVNTEPMQDGPEVLELRALVQRLHSELDTLKNATPAAAAPAAPTDATVRALLEQGTATLRALADVAQSAQEHKTTAERLQGEMVSYQQMAHAAMIHAHNEWQQPQSGYHNGGVYNASNGAYMMERAYNVGRQPPRN